MPVRSNRITLRDVRLITQSVYECCDQWADPVAWQTHMMARAARLAGCRIGIYLDMVNAGGHAANRTVEGCDVGWESDAERRLIVSALALQPVRFSPLWANFADRLAGREAHGLIARQDRVIDLSAWQSSEMYDRYVRPTRLGHVMLSATWVPYLKTWSVFSLVTDRGEPAPTVRNARLVRLMHRQIATHFGTTLATWRDRTVDGITAARRRVLEALLAGDSEPQIAKASFRSRSAVHEHVTALYRHFGVGSRAELSAYFLRRRPEPTASGMPDLGRWLDRAFAA